MECTRRNLLGIAIGAATMVLVANIFNHFLGWEISAIIVGLIVGLEAGFWIGAPTVTKEVHKEVFGALRGLPRLVPSIIAILGIFSSGLFLCPLAYCHSSIFLFNHIPAQLDFIKLVFLAFTFVGCFFIFVTWLVFLLSTIIYNTGDSWFEEQIKKGVKGNLGSAAIVVLASPLVGIVAAFLTMIALVVVLTVAPVLLIGVALRFAVAPAFLALFILCGKHETANFRIKTRSHRTKHPLGNC